MGKITDLSDTGYYGMLLSPIVLQCCTIYLPCLAFVAFLVVLIIGAGEVTAAEDEYPADNCRAEAYIAFWVLALLCFLVNCCSCFPQLACCYFRNLQLPEQYHLLPTKEQSKVEEKLFVRKAMLRGGVVNIALFMFSFVVTVIGFLLLYSQPIVCMGDFMYHAGIVLELLMMGLTFSNALLVIGCCCSAVPCGEIELFIRYGDADWSDKPAATLEKLR
eukprot:CAMPEP_0114620760 /NCGR_PEP_ID=MMETSP0168-20121206/8889_1 /TAXON_ID=95228 ORGANISM="Vannella sp., Strain DIVA3 517/6/12" /NCGR_SAMPLE_ID=MMETSP0168 /ASSEMBLY_ACC=CAM_ASM_000044 /LENGTH=217 /DNA_ID=CAMNT_0001831957 /DNA_START=66 /DNA_END=716 /DNA_ORIENTATION=+